MRSPVASSSTAACAVYGVAPSRSKISQACRSGVLASARLLFRRNRDPCAGVQPEVRMLLALDGAAAASSAA